jgi:uncharacterized protein
MKVTLITGASSGIGEAFARKLAADKHNLVLVARTENKLHELCDELMLKHKIMAHYIVADLTDSASLRQIFKETENHAMEVDWIINNAGFGSMGDFAELKLENELEMVSLNITALVTLTHHYLQKMRERKSGVIINVSSSASFQPIPYMAIYAATKAFVTSFSEAIAEENRAFKIKVLACCPGATATNFFDVAGMSEPFSVKGVQTPEQVVEETLRAVKRRKTRVITGWMNWTVAHIANLAPNSMVTKSIASQLRPRLSKILKKNND